MSIQIHKQIIASIFVLAGLISGPSIFSLQSANISIASTTVVSQISSSANDAEERVANGNVDLTSLTLELGEDNNASQLVGLRFTNVAIPDNAIILNAYLEFEVAQTNSISTSLNIRGQAADNAPAFSSTRDNISTRPRTTSHVTWNNIPAWTTLNARWQTPNISSIVQEIVNRSNWISGNSIVIIIDGSGQRTAKSYNASASAAPKLVIEFTLPTPTPTPTNIATLTPSLGAIRFGVTGDYGDGSQAEADVANLVKSWNPDFIITTGDNNYPEGEASTIDPHIGQFYHEFIYPYTGTFGSGATTNRFFPSLGNHDWTTQNARPYLDYFTLPGNERYYEYVWGPVHFFVIDSDDREPDGNTSSSTQATWLHNRLLASTSTWNLVYFHHSPYSSGSMHPSDATLQWPYSAWGADAVLTAHSHTYERIFQNGIVYFVNGVGGGSLHTFGTPVSGSQVRYSADYGAMLVVADTTRITFQFINRANVIIDSYTLQNSPTTPTPAPSAFSKINPANTATSQPLNAILSWGTSNNASYYEYCIDTTNDNACGSSWNNNGAATSKALSGLNPNTTYYWQVRATNNFGTTVANNNMWWSFATLPCYTLVRNVNPSGSGGIVIDPAPNCNGGTQYVSDTVVQLSAVPNTNYAFVSWSGNLTGSSNPVTIPMNANKSVTANFALANIHVYIGGIQQESSYVPPQGSARKSYNDDNGPLLVASVDGVMPILASERFIQTFMNSASYAEMMGYPGDQLATEYWFPWYNNLSYSTQLRVSNMGGTNAEVKVYAGSSTIPVDTFTLSAGQGARKSYSIDDGPLHVVSTDGVTPILVSERFIQTFMNSASFAELMGYPGDQLATEYWFPWYNNINYSTQLRVSNMGNNTAEIKVYAGNSSDAIDTITLSAGQGARKSYQLDDGPLRVVSTDGATPILASVRFIYTYQNSASYAEMMGYPSDQLTSEYCFPWYNTTMDGELLLSSQLRVSNFGNTDINVKIYLAGIEKDSFALTGGEGRRVSYQNFNNGPLCVVRTSGTAPILASERFISTYLDSASYSEMMGYPTNKLASNYWFPWYNNISYSTELRIARP
jgi:hypothetical protein